VVYGIFNLKIVRSNNMTTLNEWFEKGIPAKEFISSMKVHKETYNRFRSVSISAEDQGFLMN
jgi:hypothetical protein